MCDVHVLTLLSFPARVTAGTMPYNANFGIDKDVWDVMSQVAQVQASRLITMRKSLKRVKLLLGMQPHLNEQQANAVDITALRVVDGKVVLGVFDVPAIDSTITTGPKGVYALLVSAHCWCPRPARPRPSCCNACA